MKCQLCGEDHVEEALCPDAVSLATPKTATADSVACSELVGADLITAERRRQISGEGWGPEHDDTHNRGELIMAADCYARTAQAQIIGLPLRDAENVEWWPWVVDGWWNPSDDPIRNLVKAGALIAAEIDRLNRKRREAPTASISDRP